MVKEGEKIMKGSVNEEDFYSPQCVATYASEDEDKTDAKNKYLH